MTHIKQRVRRRYLLLKFLLLGLLLFSGQAGAGGECVILLHGLARTENSMQRLEERLSASGYGVANIGYPSRYARIEALSAPAIRAGLDVCGGKAQCCTKFVRRHYST